MFEQLASYPRIVVTGPQRSGTTIASRMIAADTGHRCVDESAFGVYDVDAWRAQLDQDNVVVQCPHMLKVILDDPRPDVLVVLMRRDLDAIHASERRIRWEELYHGNSTELAAFGLSDGDSAAVKYSYWATSPKPPHFLELDYETLRTHPLYVAPSGRADFGRKQTQVQDDGWRQWVATCALLGIPDEQVAQRASAFGRSPGAVAGELNAVRAHPYFPAGARLGYRVRKLEAILEAARTVARVSPVVTAVERRRGLSEADFLAEHYARNRPVVLDDIGGRWIARRWTPEDLAADEALVVVEERGSDMDGPSLARRVLTSAYLEALTGRRPPAAGHLAVAPTLAGQPRLADLLTGFDPLPPFLAADPAGAETSLRLGPPDIAGPLAYDVRNLLVVQLSGRSRHRLFSPDQTPLLYNEGGTTSSVDAERPDLTKHPAFAGSRPVTVELAPGEALFVPVAWWHQERRLDPGVSVVFGRFTVDNEFPGLARVALERP